MLKILIVSIVLSIYSLSAELKKTYTWHLIKDENSKQTIPLIDDWDSKNISDDYLKKSIVPLNTTVNYTSSESGDNNNYTVFIRSRGTEEYIPNNPLKNDFGFRFNHWEYVRKYIFWGGSKNEGTILAPDPYLIDIAHEAGVKIYGTVFLAPGAFGGSYDDFKKLGASNHAVLKKLTEIAKTLNFDGWLLNLESPLDGRDFLNQPYIKNVKDYVEKINSDEDNIEYIVYTQGKGWHGYGWNNKYGELNHISINDSHISNVIYSTNKEYKVMDDVNIYHTNDKSDRNYKTRKYILYLAEPVWNIMKGSTITVDAFKCNMAYNAIDKFFNGSIQTHNGFEEWKGLKYFARKGIKSQTILPKCLEVENIVKSRDFTSSSDMENKHYTTDTIIETTHEYTNLDSGLQNITFDLNNSVDIKNIKLWHYYGDKRTYHDVIIQVSNDKDFLDNSTFTVFNNDKDNSAGFGIGIDSEYAENKAGKNIFIADNIPKVRYVRFYSNGSTTNEYNHYVEVKIFTSYISYENIKLTFSKYNDYKAIENLVLFKNTILDRYNPFSTVITDGKSSNTHNYANLPSGLQNITFDLNNSVDIKNIKLWHYYGDKRTYHDVIIQVSNDKDFLDNSTFIVFNNDKDNSAGFGIGIDSEYAENKAGKNIFIADNIPKVRYVRFYSNGSTTDEYNHYVEVKINGIQK